jgi:murein DD-endopeptidase MepM/ murein hydrolase activator NlpD
VSRPPYAWAAILGVALGIFAVAFALIFFRPGDNLISTVHPTNSLGAQVSPDSSGQPITTLAPGQTPSPEPSPISTDKVGPRHSVGPKQLTGYGWPLKRPLISSYFSHRDFGNFIVVNGVEIHDGLDLASGCNDKVYATHDGTVLANDRTFNSVLGYEGHPEEIYDRLARRGRATALAIAVVIDDGNGYRSQYMHLKEATVEVGQVVHRGDQIGVEGETGAATGCHVHYSLIRMDGVWQPIIKRLWKYGYPEMIREHVNPIDVLPWDDDWAPRRLYNKIHPPSPTPSPDPNATPTPTPTPSATPTPSPSPTASPTPHS